MQTRTRTAALINSLLFVTAWLFTDWGMRRLLAIDSLIPSAPSPGAEWIVLGILAAVFAVVAFLLSRSDLVMGLDDAGFGWRGLANWALCGLLTGMFTSLTKATFLRWLGEDSFLDSCLNMFNPIAAISLAYWLVFRRNPFTIRQPKSAANKTFTGQSLGWFLVLGGLFVGVFGGWYFFSAFRQPGAEILTGALTLVMGLAGVLMGLGMLLARRSRVGQVAMLAGMLCAFAGLVLGIIFIVQKLLA